MENTDSNLSKADLINIIKEWKQLDEELKLVQKQMKNKREKKKKLTEQLVKIMRTNEIDCFDINNGKLLYTQNKIKEPINKTYLLNVISKYFENDDSIEIDSVADFILDNRSIKYKEGIRCKLNKN